MSGRRDGVLVVGPSAPAIGGIATYVDTMRGEIATELLVVNSVRGTGRKLGRFFRTLTGIARLRGRCRVLHLHSSHGTSFYEKVALLAAGRAMGYRTVLHMHGSNFEETVAHAPAPWLVRAGLESADVVIALSTHWTRVIQGAAPRARVMKLENVVQVPAAPCPARGSHDVLLLAGLEDRKGVPDAIHAFAAISARFPAARLVLAGPVAPHDGERYRDLARTLGVADRVVFTGSVEGEAKAALLSGCGVFILPSYAEGLPLALLEAMAAGRPVVAGAVGGIPEVLEHGVNGYLVTPGDRGALACHVAALLEDDALRDEIGRRGWDTVRTRFDVHPAAERLRSLYRELGARA